MISLDQRERKVLTYMMYGHRDAEIAVRMNVGAQAISNLLSRVRTRTGNKTNPQLLIWALAHGYIKYPGYTFVRDEGADVPPKEDHAATHG